MGDIRELDPLVLPAAEALLEVARLQGWDPVVTSVQRSSSRQAMLYEKYLRGETPYTVAPPGSSMHEINPRGAGGIAFDLSVAPHQKGKLMTSRLRILGRLWMEAGGTWGGSFRKPDPVHFDARRALS